MSATRTEAVTASEHLGMLNSSLEFVNQKLHNNLTRPRDINHLTFQPLHCRIIECEKMHIAAMTKTVAPQALYREPLRRCETSSQAERAGEDADQ